MQVILQGSLQHFPAAELLPLIANHAHGGTLTLESGPRRTRVFFREGKIDWTEAGALGAEEAILDLFTWTGGLFSLSDETALPDGAKPLDLDPAILIEEGIRRASALREAMSRYRAEQMFCVTNPPGERDQISLSPAEFNVLFRIGSGRLLSLVAADLGRTFAEIVPIVRTLEASGLIREMPFAAVGDQTVADQAFQLSAAEPAPPKTQERKKMGRTLAGSLTSVGVSPDVHPLLDTEYLIGRDPANSIVIADSSVSSTHARITRTTDGFIIEDLKSRNGTFVNGERVTEARPLADNDVIRLGRVVLNFNVATETNVGEMTNPEPRL